MASLALYAALDRAGLRNYRAKIMVVAFVGTHIPLIALLAYVSAQTSTNWTTFATTLGVTLAATLAGTGITLVVLHHLLRPLSMTARALRRFRTDRSLTRLPLDFRDEAGTLMADAAETMNSLDRAIDLLEHVDEVTSLPNRRRMLELVAGRTTKAAPFAVAVIRFGQHGRIADTLDLARAQAAMSTLAGRLRGAANPEGRRSEIVLGAISGSEFALILPGASDAGGVAETLMRIVREAGEEIPVDDMLLRPALLSGAALFPADGTEAAILLDHATAAAAQASPAAPVLLHSPEARTAARDRYRLEQDLRMALDRDELEMHYQPVVDLAAGRVVGSEALVRWRHPERGMVPPGLFIPVAEASGLIDEIGAWILRDACRQISVWTAEGRNLQTAVNLSARQFADPRLHDRLRDAITANDIDPTALEIELTETAAMVDHGHSRKVFGALRDLGLGIAIDDFGTGYASLSTLRALPFTKLKIDREFVTDVHSRPPSQAICEALLALSRGLDLRILAEGTETAEEVRFLHDRGCMLFQGYHFARPMPVAEFGAFVDDLDRSLTNGAAKAA